MSCLDESEMRAFSTGSLPPDREAHVLSCPSCTASTSAVLQHTAQRPSSEHSIVEGLTFKTPLRPARDVDVSALQPGHRVGGRYEIIHTLGAGGMGTVYEALHLQLGRPVALKVLSPSLSSDHELIARFMREGRAAAAIRHPHIVEVFDLDSDGPLTFIAMEKLEGEDLKDRIARSRPLSPAFVAQIGAELADAIATAHEAGVIHRDLKPANVFLATRGPQVDLVKVLDFGIAKLSTQSPEQHSLTATGELIGTPAYMAPEQLRGGREADARIDVYGIGVLLYEALAGRPPFLANTFSELTLKIVTEEAAPLATLRADLPARLVELIEGAMKKNPAERIATARELATALRATLTSQSPLAVPAPPPAPPRAPRRWGPWVAGALALIVGAAAVLLAVRPASPTTPQISSPVAPPASSAPPQPTPPPTTVAGPDPVEVKTPPPATTPPESTKRPPTRVPEPPPLLQR